MRPRRESPRRTSRVGPSWVGDEVTRFPFHKWYWLRIVFRADASRQWTSLAIALVCDTAQMERLRQARRFADAGR